MLASHGNVYAPGGQAVFTDARSGRDVFVYHYIPANGSRPYDEAFASLGLNGIDWSSVRGLCGGAKGGDRQLTGVECRGGPSSPTYKYSQHSRDPAIVQVFTGEGCSSNLRPCASR